MAHLGTCNIEFFQIFHLMLEFSVSAQIRWVFSYYMSKIHVTAFPMCLILFHETFLIFFIHLCIYFDFGTRKTYFLEKFVGYDKILKNCSNHMEKPSGFEQKPKFTVSYAKFSKNTCYSLFNVPSFITWKLYELFD